MRTILSTSLVVALLATAAAAEDRVPPKTLAAFGLADMEPLSDAQGMRIRGMAASAMASGTSVVFGQLVTPDTKNFVVGSDVNMVQASQEVADGDPTAFKEHFSFLNLDLGAVIVDSSGTTSFLGSIDAAAGGVGFAQSDGIFTGFPIGIAP